jgi:hypothetical protein
VRRRAARNEGRRVTMPYWLEAISSTNFRRIAWPKLE